MQDPHISAATDHILVVEDDRAIREAMVELLEDEGFHVAVAGHGREALEQLQHPPQPAVILLDLMMPVMSGREFLAARSHLAGLADIPVILISADRGVRETAEALGIKDYLVKPIQFRQLLETVLPYCGAGPHS